MKCFALRNVAAVRRLLRATRAACLSRVGREVHRADLRERAGAEGADDPGGHPERDRQEQQPERLPHQAVLRGGQPTAGQLQQGLQAEGGEGGNAGRLWLRPADTEQTMCYHFHLLFFFFATVNISSLFEVLYFNFAPKMIH